MLTWRVFLIPKYLYLYIFLGIGADTCVFVEPLGVISPTWFTNEQLLSYVVNSMNDLCEKLARRDDRGLYTTLAYSFIWFRFGSKACNGVAATCTFQAMYSHILSSSEASPTFGHANANINHYHYSFL